MQPIQPRHVSEVQEANNSNTSGSESSRHLTERQQRELLVQMSLQASQDAYDRRAAATLVEPDRPNKSQVQLPALICNPWTRRRADHPQDASHGYAGLVGSTSPYNAKHPETYLWSWINKEQRPEAQICSLRPTANPEPFSLATQQVSGRVESTPGVAPSTKHISHSFAVTAILLQDYHAGRVDSARMRRGRCSRTWNKLSRISTGPTHRVPRWQSQVPAHRFNMSQTSPDEKAQAPAAPVAGPVDSTSSLRLRVEARENVPSLLKGIDCMPRSGPVTSLSLVGSTQPESAQTLARRPFSIYCASCARLLCAAGFNCPIQFQGFQRCTI